MAKGNWNANPPPQSGAAQTDKDRGKEVVFNTGAPSRKTGFVGRGSIMDNEVPLSKVVPKGKPQL